MWWELSIGRVPWLGVMSPSLKGLMVQPAVAGLEALVL